MTRASDLSDEELVAELSRRGSGPRCRCQRWKTFYGAWDRRGVTWRCHGCLKAIDECTCR